DDALATLDAAGDPGAFAPRFQEVRGDAYHAKGNIEAALKEYRAARAADLAAVVDTQLLDLKIHDLASGGASSRASGAASPSVTSSTEGDGAAPGAGAAQGESSGGAATDGAARNGSAPNAAASTESPASREAE